MSPCALAWDAAGRPRRDSLDEAAEKARLPAGAACAACGGPAEEPVPASATVAAATFTEQHLLADRRSPATCYPCAWAMSGRPPTAVRAWTVAVSPAAGLGPSHPKSADAVPGEHPGLLCTARNDMRPVAALLTSPPAGPWCASVAESGQKHALPWTTVNQGGGPWHVRMDQLDVHGTPAELGMLLGRSARLRAAGFTSADIESLDPRSRVDAGNLPAWREHAGPLGPWRASPLLHLANFLINKEHCDHYIGTYRVPA